MDEKGKQITNVTDGEHDDPAQGESESDSEFSKKITPKYIMAPTTPAVGTAGMNEVLPAGAEEAVAAPIGKPGGKDDCANKGKKKGGGGGKDCANKGEKKKGGGKGKDCANKGKKKGGGEGKGGGKGQTKETKVKKEAANGKLAGEKWLMGAGQQELLMRLKTLQSPGAASYPTGSMDDAVPGDGVVGDGGGARLLQEEGGANKPEEELLPPIAAGSGLLHAEGEAKCEELGVPMEEEEGEATKQEEDAAKEEEFLQPIAAEPELLQEEGDAKQEEEEAEAKEEEEGEEAKQEEGEAKEEEPLPLVAPPTPLDHHLM